MASKSQRNKGPLAEKLILRSPRDVWLAGLGALSVAQKEGSRIAEEGVRFYEKLVSEGRKFEKKWSRAARNEAVDVAEDLAAAARETLQPDEPMAYHLLPKGDGWTVRLEGHTKDISLHTNKNAALSAARGLAQAHEPSRLVVHRADGTIQTSFSYGVAD
ncbi:MAG: DUF2188 domain-containing protein [Lysobacterales bacterium]|jgi:hypothetical protein